MKKTETITIRISGNVNKKIEDYAGRAGVTKSELVRRILAKREVYFVEGLPEITVAVLKLGNNVNQIARAWNSGNFVNVREELAEVAGALNEIKDAIRALQEME